MGRYRRFWIWGIVILGVSGPLLLVASVLVIRHYFIGSYTIPQNGMYPTLPAGSYFIADKYPYKDPSQVARGDIICFTRTKDGSDYSYIWRVVGLPGDTVQTTGDNVIINGQELTQEKVRLDGDMVIYKETNGDSEYRIAFGVKPPDKKPPDVNLTVPQGQFFVLGDNRHNALDSRYNGPVPFDSIIAKKK
jgi:signal peptidase I